MSTTSDDRPDSQSRARDRLARLTNRIVSGSATIIAVIALATAVYQARLSRDQAKASVWPYLVQGNSGENGYSRIVQNVGLGPAIIRGFEVRVDGTPTRDWTEVAAKLGIQPTWRGKRSTTFRAGLVVPTGTLVELVSLPDSNDIRLFRGQVHRVQTWVCFCSLYGDCWENRSETLESTRVEACTDDPARRFLE